MNNPDAPYLPAQSAAQQTMQSPQSGKPSLTGGAGAGAGGALPQSPGSGIDQAGGKSLTALVEKLAEAIMSLDSQKIQEEMAELSQAAQVADKALKQIGASQYPAPVTRASLDME